MLVASGSYELSCEATVLANWTNHFECSGCEDTLATATTLETLHSLARVVALLAQIAIVSYRSGAYLQITISGGKEGAKLLRQSNSYS